MDIDLNIENYNLKDILKLFNLDYNFSKEDIKKCKKNVLEMHPDKSGLEKDYFLFYSKAYRLLIKIYEFKNKDKINKNSSNKYFALDDNDCSKQQAVYDLMNNKNVNFNNWFNDQFEKLKISNENELHGYGNWLKSDDDIYEIKSKNMKEEFENRKKKLFQIIEQQDIQGINCQFSELDNSRPDYYQSDLFANLQFEDIKKAHTENVIPISEEYLNNIKIFNNINELSIERSKGIKPLSEEESNILISKNKFNDDKKHTQIAYKILKDQEKFNEQNKIFWKNLSLLK